MSVNTKIEWTDSTWNPLRGCSRVSEGCWNCYAEKVAYRFSGVGQPYEGLAVLRNGHASWTGKVALVEKHLLDPLHWGTKFWYDPDDGARLATRPRRIFVNSMSDLFHENVPDAWIDKIFAVMALCPQHVFQVLTKRPQRMLAYLNEAPGRLADAIESMRFDEPRRAVGPLPHLNGGETWFPLANVWLGVSVEDQLAADERIPLLLQAPAVIRFLSCEPLLGPIDFDSTHESDPITSNFLTGIDGQRVYDGRKVAIDWVICGGESGAGARPMHPDWVRSLRGQCVDARVPFFFKQWGEWEPSFDFRGGQFDGVSPSTPVTRLAADGHPVIAWRKWKGHPRHGLMVKTGKKRAGFVLDGREWREFPEVSS